LQPLPARSGIIEVENPQTIRNRFLTL
jgi:hypothetical protein